MSNVMQPNVGIWPKEKLLLTPPELPMEERVRRYQHNIQAIHEAGCLVPSAMVDSVDPEEIRAWFEAGERRIAQLKRCIRYVASLPDEDEPVEEDEGPFLECDFDDPAPIRPVPVRMISPRANRTPSAKTFVIDTAALQIAGLNLKVAMCVDAATRRVLGHGISASADDALVTALGNAIFADGVPDTVLVDDAMTAPELAQECEALGVTLARIPPYSGEGKPIERAFRDFAVHISTHQEPTP